LFYCEDNSSRLYFFHFIKQLILFFSISACTSQEQVSYSSGEEVYQARCSSCHGSDLSGRVGPSLNAESSAGIFVGIWAPMLVGLMIFFKLFRLGR